MKNTELRIGNLFLEKFSQTKIKVLELLSNERIIFEGDFKNNWQAEPIPITEEWLVNLGFKKNENGLFNLINDSEVEILIRDDFWTCDGIVFSLFNLKYIHQLQNLYFAITGNELSYED